MDGTNVNLSGKKITSKKKESSKKKKKKEYTFAKGMSGYETMEKERKKQSTLDNAGDSG